MIKYIVAEQRQFAQTWTECRATATNYVKTTKNYVQINTPLKYHVLNVILNVIMNVIL